MTSNSLRLYKREKLCSTKDIDALFGRSGDVSSAIAYPLRAVWRVNSLRRDSTSGARFVIVVPKRRLRHAVDRVAMRRRIREAYRLNRHLFDAAEPWDIGFVFVADHLKDYADISRAMVKLLSRISNVADK